MMAMLEKPIWELILQKMNIKLLFDQILNGIVLGSMYALFASGLTLIWGTMRMLNFAHGELYMLGGYFVYFATSFLGLSQIIAIPLAVISCFLFGMICERVIIHPLLNRPEWDANAIIVTLGLSVCLQNFALIAWGERYKNVPYFINGILQFYGMRIAYQRLLIVVIAFIAIMSVLFFLKKTRFGMAIRATAQNREGSIIIGIDFHKIYLITFGISSGLTGLSAAMLVPISGINPWIGTSILLKAFVVAVLGGLGSFGGAILAGIALGMVESVSLILFSSQWKDIFSFVILIVVLATRPSGFFGQKEW